jgi:ubiquitin-protein ligase E3 A
MMQQFITIYVYQFRCIDDNVAAATKSLSLLNQANELTNTIPYTEFYNDAINELVDFQEDYTRWKDTNQASFSFCAHPFILDPSVKAKILQLDSASQMRTEILRGAIFRSLLLGSEQPYLVLKVSRENIIEDTLQQVLALTADLKKPIKVVFKGEEGIDEGGVQKEFFQLIVREMFDTKFGMFLHDSESNTVWFSQVQGNDREYFLVGLVLGLAIYNGVILDVHFPLVVYKKLVGQPVNARCLSKFSKNNQLTCTHCFRLACLIWSRQRQLSHMA